VSLSNPHHSSHPAHGREDASSVDRILASMGLQLLQAPVGALDPVLEKVLAQAGEFLGAQAALLFRGGNPKSPLELQLSWSAKEGDLPAPSRLSLPLDLFQRTDQPATDLSRVAEFSRVAVEGWRGFLVPFLQHGVACAFVLLHDGDTVAFDEADVAHARILGGALSLGLERRDREHLAQRDKFYLDTLLANFPDAVYFKDRESRFLRASKFIIESGNFPDENHLIGKTDFDIFLEEHARDAFEDEQRILLTGLPIVGKEERETRADGVITWALTTKVPLRDQQGRIIGTMGISKDMTAWHLLREALEESREALADRNAIIEDDLERARIIHRMLLPVEAPRTSCLRAAYRYESLDAVGGDFLSFHPLPGDGLATFIGDLTGHGVSAALFMSLLKVASERAFAEKGNDPAQYLQYLDRELRHQIPNGFVTAIYGRLEPITGGGMRFKYGCAGHPEPVLHHADGRVEFLPLSEGALGLMDGFKRVNHVVELLPGDRLFLYTDGIPETANVDNEMLGFEMVAPLIAETYHEDFDAHLDAIMARVAAFRGLEPRNDDIALVGFEVQ
jgi:phosphoserine phosphatase RsbU/P